MWKHIVIQSLIQIVILLILYLIAPEFVKEQDLERLAENRIINYCYGEMPGKGDKNYIIYGTEAKWSNDIKLGFNIDKDFCGKYKSRQSLNVAFKEYSNANGGSVHMSLIFNVFVIYTLFNQVNCRMIDDSLNIFKRVQNSILFIIITIVELGLQVLIVCIGKSVFHVSNNGLTGDQWGICIGFSAITFVVSIIVKFLPLEKCIDSCLSDEDSKDEGKKDQKYESNSSTDLDTDNIKKRTHKKRKQYDQPNPNEEKRVKEDRDILKLSENSSIEVPKEKENL